MDWEAGMVIGNEATGVLKRTAFFWEGDNFTAGLTHKNAHFHSVSGLVQMNLLRRHWFLPGCITNKKNPVKC